ncbi:G kinase-anchoring protein 1-like [Amphiura filiformis]|uniref:G kinase-anchoring protein 1-like n=1 Tax=Amphiura filiformis TaxID=82378 RepID=UPI003B210550
MAPSPPKPTEVGGANIRKYNKPPEQWEQWKVQDQGYVENQYETDLQKAILQSKLEFEQQKLFYDEIRQGSSIKPETLHVSPQEPSSPHKQPPLLQPQQPLLPPHSQLQPGHKPKSLYQRMDQLEDFDTLHVEPEPSPSSVESPPGAATGSKKEKKKQGKSKQHAMSLQEFQTAGSSAENGVSGGDSANLPKKSPSGSEEDKHFFDKIDQDVASILSKDQIKKARKQNEKFVAEHARRVQYEDQLEQKDKVISGLKEVIEKVKKELAQVKKRNKQLCFILAQGEMKDKADVLKQVEDLTSVKDELTIEVAELHGSLEQERSKVHSLKSELQKLQDRKK